MTPLARLALILGMIAVSAIVGVIASQNDKIAGSVATGYIAMLLTVFVICNVWKKP